jgi:hypothetical protein
MNKLFIPILLAAFISCTHNKKTELIGQDIAGVDTRISRILVNKYAFQRAIVKIRGKVKHLEKNSEDGSIRFQLTDRKGNFINIVSDKKTDLHENDYIILSGEYDSAENLIILFDYEKFPT